MANDRITGPQKAALFLFLLGEELASEIVKNLDEEEIKKLGASMSKNLSASPKAVESIYAEFQQLTVSEQPLQLGTRRQNQFLKSVFNKALEGDKAETLYEKIQGEGNWNLFQKVRKLDSKTVANFIRNEHPQTIAVVLAHLDSGQAAAVVEEFPPPLQTEVLSRIAQLEKIHPGILEEIDQTIQQEISQLENAEGGKMGGVRTVAEILNRMDGSLESQILQGMEDQKQGMSDEIRRLMFVFEDLGQMDDRSMMALLKEINNDNLKLALKTASEELKEKIFRNMSERAVQMLKEDLEVMGPVRLKDVEGAQQAIIKTAKKLEGEGKVTLSGKGKEEAFV